MSLGGAGGPTTRVCRAEGCPKSTSELKPYCIKHVSLNGYGGEVARELERAERELERAAKHPSGRLPATPSCPKGKPVKVDLEGSVCFDVLRVIRLADGKPLTLGRIARDARITPAAVNAYVTALAIKGVVKRCPAGRDQAPGARYTGDKDASP
jgi:hypothetical protein